MLTAETCREHTEYGRFDASPVPVAVLGTDLRVRYANAAAYAQVPALRQGVLPPNCDAAFLLSVQECLAGRADRTRTDLRAMRGLMCTLVPTPPELTLVFRRQEESLTKQALRGWTHDIRQQLATMLTACQLLDRSEHLTGPESRYLSILTSNTAALIRAEKNLSAVLANDLDEEPLIPEMCDLGRLLSSFAEQAAEVARKKGAEMNLALPERPVVTLLDQQSLERALLNIISNSLRFGAGRIGIRLRCDGETAEITVRDDGVGIPPENREQVFELFYATRPPQEKPGSGIGLFLVRQLLRRQGGEAVALEPEDEGGGALFRLTLPLRSGELPALFERRPEPPQERRRRFERELLV